MTLLVLLITILSTVASGPLMVTSKALWHTSKAGRKNPPSRKVGSETQTLHRESDPERQPRSQPKASFFAFGPNPAKLSFLLGAERLRSPPA